MPDSRRIVFRCCETVPARRALNSGASTASCRGSRSTPDTRTSEAWQRIPGYCCLSTRHGHRCSLYAYDGHQSLHVDSRAVHLLPEFKCSFGPVVYGSVGIGLARFETKIGSNEFCELPVIVPINGVATQPPWLPIYSGTRRSWTGIGKASLRAAVSRSWMAEVNAHYTRASAIDADYDSNADIGNRRLEILGVALDLVWRLPAK